MAYTLTSNLLTATPPCDTGPFARLPAMNRHARIHVQAGTGCRPGRAAWCLPARAAVIASAGTVVTACGDIT
jgi:hypothetical protein